MENVDKICPICSKHPIALPNGVCSVCYNKVKTQADWNTTEWGKIENHGLDAIIVLAKYILDEIEDDDQHQWHLRRICFMQDMVEYLDKRYFPNATIQQINDFAHSAVDFWKGKITSQEATEQLQSMRKVLQKDIMKLSDWEPKDFLLWMMMLEDDFDWMWDQWFECIHACIPDKCNDELWIRMFHKHFPNEIKAWVDNNNNDATNEAG